MFTGIAPPVKGLLYESIKFMIMSVTKKQSTIRSRMKTGKEGSFIIPT